MREKIVWLLTGGIVFFILTWLSGGIYTITPPNGPMDVAYKMNRITGKVWMVKSYSKQVGSVRVLVAREAEVERTKDLSEADLPGAPVQEVSTTKRRR